MDSFVYILLLLVMTVMKSQPSAIAKRMASSNSTPSTFPPPWTPKGLPAAIVDEDVELPSSTFTPSATNPQSSTLPPPSTPEVIPEAIDDVFDDMDESFADNPDVEIASRTDVPGLSGEYQIFRLRYRPPSETFVRYQSDMLLEETTFQHLTIEDDTRRRRSAGLTNASNTWPNPVAYEIEPTISEEQKMWIMQAIMHVMQHTCVVFKQRGQEQDYVKFAQVARGCFTFVGFRGKESRLSLSTKCKKRHIVHEIGHILGLYHEHSRNDRDQYIRIIKKNIKKSKVNQFDKMDDGHYDDYDLPYDYRSIMHYGKNYFGKKENGKKRITMKALDKSYTDVIGTATGLSFHDIQALNTLYKCAAGCQPKKCKADQFLGKGCKCYCAERKNKNAVPCPQPTSCLVPSSICPMKNCFTDKDTHKKLNSGDEVVHGHTVVIGYCNTKPCGNVTSNIKCNDGLWEGNTTLQCIKETCEIDPMWNIDFNIVPQQDGSDLKTRFHGQKILMECPDNSTIVSTLTCLHGEWQGEIFPCTGDDCSVVDIVDDMFQYTPDNLEDYDNGTIQHGAQVNVSCTFNDKISTLQECNNGQLIGDIPVCSDGESCELNSDWDLDYIVSPSAITIGSNSIDNDQYVEMHCLNNTISFYLDCFSGKWNGTIIPCTGESCVVSNKPDQLYKIFLDADDLADDEVVDHGTRVYVSCKYDETIATNATCNDGILQEETPVDCPRAAPCLVPKVANGKVKWNNVGDSIESGNQVTLTCGKKEIVAKCNNGKWNSGKFPICPKDDLRCPKPDNAIVTGPFTRYNPYTIQCQEGFVKLKAGTKAKLNYNNFRCKENGKWGPKVPVCSPGPCSVPVVEHGNVHRKGIDVDHGDNVKSGEKVQVKCDYIRNSKDVTVSCNLGKWTPAPFPTCPRAAPCLIPDIANGKMMRSKNVGGSIKSGEQVTLTCGNKEFIANCNNGEWNSGKFPVCPKAELRCPRPENAIVTGPFDNRFNPYTIQCKEGFVKLKKGTMAKLHLKNFRCKVNRKWGPKVPVCSPAPCSVPAVDSGSVYQAKLVVDPGDTVKSGREVHLNCKYAGNAKDATVSCNLGEWTPAPFPTCPKAAPCLIPKVANGNMRSNNVGDSIESGKHVTLTCGNKEFIANCNNGEWNSGKFPVCPKVCPKPENAIVTGPFDRYNPYTIQCEEGFVKLKQTSKTKLNINNFRCKGNGKWGPTVPICSPAPCSVQLVDNGRVLQKGNRKVLHPGATIKSGTEVVVACTSKDAAASCYQGKWTPDPFPVCPKVCRSYKGWKLNTTHRLVYDDQTRHRIYDDNGFQTCKDLCEQETEFLCLAVSYGFDLHKNVETCALHRVNPEDHQKAIRSDIRFSIATRLCDRYS